MIRQVRYTLMACDDCATEREVWESRPLEGWVMRNEWNGSDGYRDRHYCPTCARASRRGGTT